MRLLVSGGGTGGHIYPAVAVAKKVKELLPKASILYVGTAAGMESNIVPRENLDFASIRSSGMRGKSLIVAAKGGLNALLGLKDAAGILRQFRPDVVLGTGGYVSGPVVLAAYIMGIPCAIQEQNAVPGKTNLVLSRLCKKTFAAWEYSVKYFPKRSKVIVTGNPVKGELFRITKEEARSFFGLSGKFTVLILGGSRGAKTLVEAGLRLCHLAGGDRDIIFITGKDYYGKVADILRAREEPGIDGSRAGNIIIRPYVYNMEMAYSASDLVVARAGGMTLAEITSLGLPSVIVPSPNVVGNHQEYNARALEEAGAACVVREDGDAPERIADAVLRLWDDEELLSKMRAASKSIGKPSAAEDIARELIKLSRGDS
ncbi:MAG TPA: undecaprenyldiphospho-muramoylpentapeptide beta-N-acetylglucosaminyltransferase [Firmicutes bacterium]|nr:undecaprenyldiphospho-muramoylpentapeptide beta-N-acetylglucosaminyltransferase [Candidatus Fermentithermobacillaceae bacterium]